MTIMRIKSACCSEFSYFVAVIYASGVDEYLVVLTSHFFELADGSRRNSHGTRQCDPPLHTDLNADSYACTAELNSYLKPSSNRKEDPI